MILHKPIDRARFFSLYRKRWGKLTQLQVDGLNVLLVMIERDPMLTVDMRYVAYFLATCKHECADTWQPIRERGNRAYFIEHYWTNQRLARSLGNRNADDAATYCGRGYVQVTGRKNYARLAAILNINCLADPDMLLEAETSYRVSSFGMTEGLFTGKRLSASFTSTTANFIAARRVVNGIDQAQTIAGYAQVFTDILR